MPRLFPNAFESDHVARYGQDAPRISIITFDLTTARNKDLVHIAGNFLWAAEASDRNALVRVAFEGQESETGIPFKYGSLIRGLPYGKVYLTHTAQAGKTITFVYCTESEGGLQIENPGELFNQVEIIKAGTYITSADDPVAVGATETVLAARATRRVAMITSLAANTGDVRVGEVGSVAAANGTPLRPGETLTLEVTAAIAIHNPTAAIQTFALAEIAD